MPMTKLLALPVLGVLFVLSAMPTSAATTYNRAAAIQYADTYWSTYNSAYPSFATKGGDCTNFVSQALYAGGVPMHTSPTYSGTAAWYMLQNRKKSYSYSVSWINVMSNMAFLQQSLGATKIADVMGAGPGQLVSDGDAQPGDVVLYDWNNDGTFDHESIITATDGTTNADNNSPNYDLVDAHTTNHLHVYWTLSQYHTDWATTHIIVLHIPDSVS
jgi:cell wall-associated NlpC family hydrolase